MDNLYKHWSTDFIIKKYKNPKSCEGRFNSELYFLKKILKPKTKILDVGCATGGLYKCIKSINKNTTYIGVDISRPLIERAKEVFPGGQFIHGNIIKDNNLFKKNKKFDLVVATGLFQHEPDYKRLLFKMLSYTKNKGYILFDVKLLSKHKTLCDINKSFGNHGDHKVYYIIFNYKEFLGYILGTKDISNNIEIYGYKTDVNFSVHLPKTVKERVCSAHILIQKDTGKNKEDNVSLVSNLPKEFLIN